MGFGGLTIATSGIRVAERNLNVTGHNISNAETQGYSRQRIIQHSAFTRPLGINSAGNRMIQVMGAGWSEVHQIRNEFLDINYRNNVSPLSFYSTKVAAGLTVETLMGELYGAYNFQTVLNNIWYSIQELTNHPEGIATRQFFLSNANTFFTKAQEVYTGLVDYQLNLDDQIRELVNGKDGINATVAAIGKLNEKIRVAEQSGDKANDWRDERHLLLDHLATMIPIDVFESPNGDLNVMSLGHHILSGTYQSTMGLRYIANEIGFVEPVFTTSKEILTAGTPTTEFTSYLNYQTPIDAAHKNDKGKLLALLQARGTIAANHISDQLPKPIPVPATANITNPDGSITYSLLSLINALEANPAITTPPTAAPPLTEYDTFIAQIEARIAVLEAIATPTPADEIELAQLRQALDHIERDQQHFIYRYITAPAAERPALVVEMNRDFDAQTHNWNAHMWSLENAMIPKTQVNLDRVVNAVATMINDALTGYLRGEDGNYIFFETNPDGTPYIPNPNDIDPVTGEPRRVPIRPTDLNNNFGVPLFVREVDILDGTYKSNNYNWPLTDIENPGKYSTIFTINNIKINPDFFEAGGHNLLALSISGAPGDTDLLVALQKVWMSNTGHYAVQIGDDTLRKFNVQDAYIRLTGEIATEIAEANSKVSSQTVQVDQAQNMRMAIMGVSMDEEMNAMLRFQFAFQAASRVFNMIDQMIDRIVNGTGRVGL